MTLQLKTPGDATFPKPFALIKRRPTVIPELPEVALDNNTLPHDLAAVVHSLASLLSRLVYEELSAGAARLETRVSLVPRS